MNQDLKKRLLIAIVFTVCFISVFWLFIGWRSDHTVLLLLITGLVALHRKTYGLVLAFSGFILFWISYETLTIYPNYLLNPVHVIEPYNWELSWFGIDDNGQRVIASKWFETRLNDYLSLIAGFSYILWMPAPMIYAWYLLLKDKPALFEFTFGFLAICFVGFIFYYAYPAAPPWYFLEYGNGTDFTIPGSEGLLSEFDRIVGASVFAGIYAKGGNVFCAIPSLHSAYPILCVMAALRRKTYIMAAIFFIWGLGTWFAAVYSQHHYIVDVLLGILCGIIGYQLFLYLQKFDWMQRFKNWFLSQLKPI